MTEERNIKTGNVLQEDDQEPILEEELFPPIIKIDRGKNRH